MQVCLRFFFCYQKQTKQRLLFTQLIIKKKLNLLFSDNFQLMKYLYRLYLLKPTNIYSHHHRTYFYQLMFVSVNADKLFAQGTFNSFVDSSLPCKWPCTVYQVSVPLTSLSHVTRAYIKVRECSLITNGSVSL